MEFLCTVLIKFAVISLLIIPLAAYHHKLQNSVPDVGSAVQAIELAHYSAPHISFELEIPYSIENNHFHTVYSGQMIESGGIFIYDDREPV